MIQDLNFLQNVISPQEEMVAYETLWAMEDIKEKRLKELFKKHTPSEALKKTLESNQLDLFSKESPYDEIKNKVDSFLKESLRDKLSAFSIVVNGNVQYPKSLTDNYPIGLFYYKGNLDLLSGRHISIVGAREASLEGILKAKQLAEELTAENFIIVSGLAKGIDTAAHQSAIDAKGYTIGVIGTPINEYYPKENKQLQDKIARDFLLISQVPFYKYAHEPFRHRTYHFPRRNMTMASISEATVIVEASDTSGSLVQARECLKQKKKLFIMDSCFKNQKIKWPASYEKKGAVRIKNSSDILKYINANQMAQTS